MLEETGLDGGAGGKAGARPNSRVQGMSSRQQVLFLMHKTQQQANWDMDNDSDL